MHLKKLRMSRRHNNNQTKWFTRTISADRVYFNYKREPYLHSKWPLFFLIIIEAFVLLTELFINHSAYMQILMVPFSLYCFYRILKHKEDVDKAIEAEIVCEQLKGVNPGGRKAKVVAKEYFIETTNEAYLKDKRFMLVVLSNGMIYKYAVEQSDKNGFILDKKASLCENENELKLVKKYTDVIRTEGKSHKVKRNSSIAAGCILAFGMVFVILLVSLGNTAWMKIIEWGIFVVFTLSLILSSSLSSYSGKNNFAVLAYKVSSWIFSGLWLVAQLVFPSLLLLVGFMFVIMVPFSLIHMTLTLVCNVWPITSPTILFLSLSVGAIISAFYSKPLFSWLSCLLMSHGHRYEKYFQEMVEYVYQPSNIQFVVFLLYVFYLFVSTILQLQAKGVFVFDKDMDLAVLESFLVFIAFSNMKTKRMGASFSFSELFRMMLGMWTTHDNIDEGDN